MIMMSSDAVALAAVQGLDERLTGVLLRAWLKRTLSDVTLGHETLDRLVRIMFITGDVVFKEPVQVGKAGKECTMLLARLCLGGKAFCMFQVYVHPNHDEVTKVVPLDENVSGNLLRWIHDELLCMSQAGHAHLVSTVSGKDILPCIDAQPNLGVSEDGVLKRLGMTVLCTLESPPHDIAVVSRREDGVLVCRQHVGLIPDGVVADFTGHAKCLVARCMEDMSLKHDDITRVTLTLGATVVKWDSITDECILGIPGRLDKVIRTKGDAPYGAGFVGMCRVGVSAALGILSDTPDLSAEDSAP